MATKAQAALIRRIQAKLTPDLLAPEYDWPTGRRLADRVRGHCYVASEALFHMLGGLDSGWYSCQGRVEGVSHWWLENERGDVLDPTGAQFERVPDYLMAGQPRGFLTRQPSARAFELLRRLGWRGKRSKPRR